VLVCAERVSASDNVEVDSTKLEMSRGGEKLDQAPKRSVDDEMPHNYVKGAFKIETDNPGVVTDDIMIPGPYIGYLERPMQENMYRSFKAVGRGERNCRVTITEPTAFVTRWEYYNLFHVSTDWCVRRRSCHPRAGCAIPRAILVLGVPYLVLSSLPVPPL
jgi:hypothetical protein